MKYQKELRAQSFDNGHSPYELIYDCEMMDVCWSLSFSWTDEKSCNDFWDGFRKYTDERNAREGKAKAICGACAVRAECLEYALKTDQEHGIWGGLTEAERRTLRPSTEHTA